MEVKQVADFVNKATGMMTGEIPVMTEDLGNVVDVGTAILNDAQGVEQFAKALPNVIGKFIFVAREYKGVLPSVLMDDWEFGSIVERVRMELPEATENESWELNDGEVYEENQFYGAKIKTKFFNKMVTFEVPQSFTELQLKQSFNSAQQLNSFISMVYNAVENSMTIKVEGFIKRAINNFIGETLHDAFPSGGYNNDSKAKAVNLLYLYNNTLPSTATPLTVEEALTTPEFVRFASKTMKNYVSHLREMTKVFNIEGADTYTPTDKLHTVLLDDFASSAEVYLQSSTFHNELTKLPKYDTVAYWQGSGTDFDFESTSKIDITTAQGHDVELSGIIGVMFDHDALGVNQYNRRTTTKYVAKAEFWNNWFKMDGRYFNDSSMNFVVFFIA